MRDWVNVRGLRLLAFVGASFIMGCGEAGSPGVIQSPGSHVSQTGSYRLDVSTPNGISYSIVNLKTGVIELKYDLHVSLWQRWFLFWDSQDNLWHYTGDDGTFVVWARSTDGTWTSREVVSYPTAGKVTFNEDLLAKMPKAVADSLPSGLKQRCALVPVTDEEGRYRGMKRR